MPLWFVLIFISLYAVISFTCSRWAWVRIGREEDISERGMFKLTCIGCLIGGVIGAFCVLTMLLDSLSLI